VGSIHSERPVWTRQGSPMLSERSLEMKAMADQVEGRVV
jgi:hypothetical protein